MTIALSDTVTTGNTASELIVDALGMLSVIDINETGASPAETAKALRAINRMISGWETGGLAFSDVTRVCSVDGSTAVLTSLVNTILDAEEILQIAPGMNVSGTGIAASSRVASLDDQLKQVTLDKLTTIAGSSVTLSFAVFPMPAKFTSAFTALLAMEMAPIAGVDNIPAMVIKLAQSGWAAICANYMRIPPMGFDPALTQTSLRRTRVVIATD